MQKRIERLDNILFSSEDEFLIEEKSQIFYLFARKMSCILVRSTGIEDMRQYKKSLDFQGFFAIERQSGRQNFLGKV